MIKSAFSLLCIVVCFLFFTTSCGMLSDNKCYSEVDLSVPTDVQITYKQNVYNARVSYQNGVLQLDIVSGADVLDGLSFEIDNENCYINYSDISHNTPKKLLTEEFFPLVIYNFISDFNGLVFTEDYDDNKLCSYVSRQIFSSSVTLEIYENNENKAYAIYIT